MAQGTNYWKLGLFVLAGGAMALIAVVLLGTRNWNKQSVQYVSYFDESVQGLELGSPVKFRGVSIGKVARIDISTDQRHVAVTSELLVERLGALELVGSGEGAVSIPTSLRVQLAQAGITGVKFVQLDYFEPAETPLPILPFPPPKNYIPATPSTMKNLETSVVKTADRFPEIAEDLSQTMAKLNALMDDIQENRLPERGGQALVQASDVMKEMNAQLRDLKAAELASGIKHTLTSFDETLQRTNRVLERLESEQGLLRSAERAVQSLEDVARGGNALGPELEGALREVRSAARSVRRFADTLERDPDMLLKGRAERE